MEGSVGRDMSERYKGKTVTGLGLDDEVTGVVVSCTDHGALVEDRHGMVLFVQYPGMRVLNTDEFELA